MNCLTIFLSAVLFIAFSSRAQTRVVLIGLDGFSTEGYNNISHPNIDRLVSDGVLSTTTRPVMPSVTLPNWTSHLTGSGPEEHGVTGNDWTVAKHSLEAIDKDAEGYYPSIFKILKEKIPGVKTAFYYNWAELIHSMNKKHIDEVSFQYNDRYDSNYAKAYNFIAANKNRPSLTFLYSVHTDHAGHGYGWMSPQYISAVKAADSAIGVFLARLKAANLYDNTYFFLITDHGGKEKSHGGTSMQEMQVPWAVTGPRIKKTGRTDLYNSNKNTSLVIARIFGLKPDVLPKSWTGTVPEGIFKR
ncbi:alkaline phosphatase family protein [Niabella drilacis]|uniref:Type I phosphodiesterase / nucleotide pyrophosphatase n=1 Tax=Niabella drilacis (strain DSM 25811 / CCM 8410 / CCUG 62505 / LMG 26954 / E90) TaxID=1285928 RepID=A0A1G6R8K3_NIADE|nr:ectonucleotide pyrophosphatase/phosphodiesterase [Niabella drilacis]SDD00858.1 Type I phosphodiesterase / nucleotide pyrophosphatase [Niabella drilacis]